MSKYFFRLDRSLNNSTILSYIGLYLGECLERLTANTKVANGPGSNLRIFRHSGIRGAADESVLNKNIKKQQNIPHFKHFIT
jgi:hypothetical protein